MGVRNTFDVTSAFSNRVSDSHPLLNGAWKDSQGVFSSDEVAKRINHPTKVIIADEEADDAQVRASLLHSCGQDPSTLIWSSGQRYKGNNGKPQSRADYARGVFQRYQATPNDEGSSDPNAFKCLTGGTMTIRENSQDLETCDEALRQVNAELSGPHSLWLMTSAAMPRGGIDLTNTQGALMTCPLILTQKEFRPGWNLLASPVHCRSFVSTFQEKASMGREGAVPLVLTRLELLGINIQNQGELKGWDQLAKSSLHQDDVEFFRETMTKVMGETFLSSCQALAYISDAEPDAMVKQVTDILDAATKKVYSDPNHAAKSESPPIWSQKSLQPNRYKPENLDARSVTGHANLAPFANCGFSDSPADMVAIAATQLEGVSFVPVKLTIDSNNAVSVKPSEEDSVIYLAMADPKSGIEAKFKEMLEEPLDFYTKIAGAHPEPLVDEETAKDWNVFALIQEGITRETLKLLKESKSHGSLSTEEVKTAEEQATKALENLTSGAMTTTCRSVFEKAGLAWAELDEDILNPSAVENLRQAVHGA